jgi:hypothetical protein
MPRRSLLVLAALLVLALGADVAVADEEVFELRNGGLFRGTVVEETADEVVVRLTGFDAQSRFTIPRNQIVRRFVSAVYDTSPGSDPHVVVTDWSASTTRVDPPPPTTVAPEPYDAVIDPGPRGEGFFGRLSRVIGGAVPPDATGRGFFVILLLAALTAIVALGGRLAEIESMTLGRTTILALALGALLALDVFHHADVMRADRAAWMLPVQAAAWTALALAVLRCGVPRATLLLAFVLFSIAVTVFCAGAVLVTF